MKITKEKLKQIIKEELANALDENLGIYRGEVGDVARNAIDKWGEQTGKVASDNITKFAKVMATRYLKSNRNNTDVLEVLEGAVEHVTDKLCETYGPC